MTSELTKWVEDVLAGLKRAEEAHKEAMAAEKWCDDKTQDLLHELELVPHTYHERSGIAKELASVRRQRRKAKDAHELLGPLVKWIGAQKSAIDAMTRVLGEMRKIDEKRDNRLYYRRADGNHEIIRKKEDQEANTT